MVKRNLIFLPFFCLLTFYSCGQPAPLKYQSSGVYIGSYNEQTIENLAVLCHIWGFIKYYHPVMAENAYNLDIELFKLIPQVTDSITKDERNLILSRWISNLKKKRLSSPLPAIPDSIVKLYPDIHWIEDRDILGEDIVKLLLKIKDSNRTGKNHYVEKVEGVGNPIFANESTYENVSFPDVGFQLLALFRYWNMIQYYYPYRYLLNEWNEILYEFIPKFIEIRSHLDYEQTLLKLISRIDDSHAGVWGSQFLDDFKGKNIYPVEISFIEDKAVVTDFFHPDLQRSCKFKIGDVILSVDGIPIDSIIEAKRPYIPASNFNQLLREVATELFRTNKGQSVVGYERAGYISHDTIDYIPIQRIGYHNIASKDKNCFSLIHDDIGYIYLGSKRGGHIPDIFNTKALIIDLRCYPSSAITGFPEYEQLLSEPVQFARSTEANLFFPGMFTFSESLEIGFDNPDYYKGKIIIIVNEITLSQSEFLTMLLKHTPNNVVIGSPTAGADGNISVLPLPGGINTAFTGIGIYYPDKGETQQIGIIPDIEVKPTIKGIREGKDEVLEVAIGLIMN